MPFVVLPPPTLAAWHAASGCGTPTCILHTHTGLRATRAAVATVNLLYAAVCSGPGIGTAVYSACHSTFLEIRVTPHSCSSSVMLSDRRGKTLFTQHKNLCCDVIEPN